MAQLDKELAKNIPTPCRWHPSGVNALFMSPHERAEVIRRVEKVLYEPNALELGAAARRAGIVR